VGNKKQWVGDVPTSPRVHPLVIHHHARTWEWDSCSCAIGRCTDDQQPPTMHRGRPDATDARPGLVVARAVMLVHVWCGSDLGVPGSFHSFDATIS
jgi:hypothetical protein